MSSNRVRILVLAVWIAQIMSSSAICSSSEECGQGYCLDGTCTCYDTTHYWPSEGCSTWHDGPQLEPGQYCTPNVNNVYCSYMGVCSPDGMSCNCNEAPHRYSSERCAIWHEEGEYTSTMSPSVSPAFVSTSPTVSTEVTAAPTSAPTVKATAAPTLSQGGSSLLPTVTPSHSSSITPTSVTGTVLPTTAPSIASSTTPVPSPLSVAPTIAQSSTGSVSPTLGHNGNSDAPTSAPTVGEGVVSEAPTSAPTVGDGVVSEAPTSAPTVGDGVVSEAPTSAPTVGEGVVSEAPTSAPTVGDGVVSEAPTSAPTVGDGVVSEAPTSAPTVHPSTVPTTVPSLDRQAAEEGVALCSFIRAAGVDDIPRSDTFKGWSCAGDIPTSNICSWTGLTCAGGYVLSIDLSARGLTGTIPAAFVALTALEELNLSGNQLVGPVPALNNFVSLRRLDLGNNLLSSTRRLMEHHGRHLGDDVHPDLLSYASLPALSYLDISGNGYTGSIPYALCLLPLETLIIRSLVPSSYPPNGFSCIANCLREESGPTLVMPANLPTCLDVPTSAPTTAAELSGLNNASPTSAMESPAIIGAIVASSFVCVILVCLMGSAFYRRHQHEKTKHDAFSGTRKGTSLDLVELKSIESSQYESTRDFDESEMRSSVDWSDSRSTGDASSSQFTSTTDSSSKFTFALTVDGSRMDTIYEDDSRTSAGGSGIMGRIRFSLDSRISGRSSKRSGRSSDYDYMSDSDEETDTLADRTLGTYSQGDSSTGSTAVTMISPTLLTKDCASETLLCSSECVNDCSVEDTCISMPLATVSSADSNVVNSTIYTHRNDCSRDSAADSEDSESRYSRDTGTHHDSSCFTCEDQSRVTGDGLRYTEDSESEYIRDSDTYDSRSRSACENETDTYATQSLFTRDNVGHYFDGGRSPRTWDGNSIYTRDCSTYVSVADKTLETYSQGDSSVGSSIRHSEFTRQTVGDTYATQSQFTRDIVVDSYSDRRSGSSSQHRIVNKSVATSATSTPQRGAPLPVMSAARESFDDDNMAADDVRDSCSVISELTVGTGMESIPLKK